MENEEIEFLQQSNYIEGVSDGLDESVEAWTFIKKKRRLTVKRLLTLHRVLMRKYLKGNHLGQYRVVPVWIGQREAVPYFIIPELMNGWIQGANKVGLTEERIKEAHIGFEKIHPFIDGNGRMGRMLLNWQRIRNGLPILVIREEERFEYYKWFN